MSVESEILRIQHNIADSYAKVSEKGGTVPLQPNSRNLAAAIGSIPQTLPAPDNNPIGTVISFMGAAAPKDYLVCDGAEYSISEYPALAEFFRQQFGSANHFGGDGETAFAVPDLRNLFLRGYHGEAEEKLSGEVGERQNGTSAPSYEIWRPTASSVSLHIFPGEVGINSRIKDFDSSEPSPIGVGFSSSSNFDASDRPAGYRYTSRPVNMAVLYCIKAAESVPAENLYSTEETRIGTWIDGKPLYRKCYTGLTSPSNNSQNSAFLDISELDVDNLPFLSGTIGRFPIPIANGTVSAYAWITTDKTHIAVYVNGSSVVNMPVTVTLEYTKTTD